MRNVIHLIHDFQIDNTAQFTNPMNMSLNMPGNHNQTRDNNNTYLPPVRVILFNNLQYITILKGQTSIFAWDHAVLIRKVVKMSTYKDLHRKCYLIRVSTV